MAEFTKAYEKKGKHRARCSLCGRLVQDGEMAHIWRRTIEGYYPVRGSMKFTKWVMDHESCSKERAEEEGRGT